MELPQLETIAERLRWARTKANLSQKELGEAVGLSHQAIEQVENNRTKRPGFLADAAKATGVPYEWLKTGSTNEGFLHKNNANSSTKIKENFDKVPVYGYAAGSSDRVAINDGAIVGMRERGNSLTYAKNGFYIVVIGDSMEPRLRAGELVAVNPALPVIRGDECVVEYADGQAIVKTFVAMTEEKITLSQYNPAKKIEVDRKSVARILPVVAIEKGR